MKPTLPLPFWEKEIRPTARMISHTPHFQKLAYVLLYQSSQAGFLTDVPPEDISPLSALALLHDIGKLALPPRILCKPGPLTPEEYEEIKTHTTLGAKMLAQILPGFWGTRACSYAMEICLHHHERWDGHGYPDGLCGDETPRYVQVIGLADAYDALLAPRSYHPAYPPQKAADMILSGKCGVFSPVLLSHFFLHLGQLQRVLSEDSAPADA